MRKILFLSVCVCLPLAVESAAAASLPAGEYRCTTGNFVIGRMKIVGNNYAGPTKGSFDAYYPYEVTPSGTINWGGPMGGLNSDGFKIISTEVKDGGYDIMVTNPDTGRPNIVSCGRD